MYAVGRLGSYISRGVYSVSGPFHPFGGAVDIIVVEQPDGSFKSSPWYVRFGKFQGVLKMKEKIVRIGVNGVEASFFMYLDHKGEAYFLKEVEDGESALWLSPPPSSSSSSSSSSGDDADGQSNKQLFKSDSFNYNENISRSETLVNSRRSQILGSMFGRQSMKDERFRTEGENGPLVGRVDSLERAEIAADLLDLNWSAGLTTKKKKKKKDVRSRFVTPDASATNLDDDDDESKEKVRGDAPALESSDEIQFIFSDLHNHELEAAKRNFDQEVGGRAELSDGADEGSLNTSIENLSQETATFANKQTKSSSIPISYTRRNGEFNQLVESMPNTRSDIKNLNSYVFQAPMSQSLDISSNTLEFIKDEKHLEKHQLNVEDIHVRPSLEMEMGVDAEKLALTGDKVEQSLDDGSSPKVMGGSWRLWPFSFSKSRSANRTGAFLDENAAENNKNSIKAKVMKKMARVTSPTSEQLASLNLKQGSNSITFTFSTAMLGNQRVEARIYLWKWNSRIIISDVDGTITKSDVLGQFMPFVGMDWSHTGVTHLFSAIKENGYQMLFLSARAISQAYLTRQFLFNLKQNGKCLPEGPVVISPDGLFPSLYREVIRRAPHEFKIACLEDIKALFPPDFNPFYAGFGNRFTDEISYLKVGIPKGKIFTINPKGQVAVNRHINTKSYTSLHALVHGMFPHTSTSHEQEAYNSWNYWKLPPADIDIDM